MKNIYLLLLTLFLIVLISCNPAKDNWTSLFDGFSLSGWKASENPESFSVEDGCIIAQGERAHLYYNADKSFKNLELVADIKTEQGANSGIYFHTDFQEDGCPLNGYEVQINNSYQTSDGKTELKKTGSLCGVRNIYFPTVNDGEWFNLRIKVIENQIEVFVNNIKVVDYIQPENPWRPENKKSQILGEGTFALQAHDNSGKVYFKNIKVKKLPQGKSVSNIDKNWDVALTKLMAKSYPFIDFHVHLKGGLTIEDVVANSLKLGINYGVAPNCGLHFPVTNDSSLNAYMEDVKSYPVFKGMQAEGREWITLFSPEAIAKFDYVFTDAMTFTDYKGRRNRIWIPEEVWVDDKDQFMDQLVGKIEAIFSQEPVDIYVNPTVLPAELMDEYSQLWTKERVERVIKVLAENNIALEINARYKTPKADMIKMAKNAGIKFSLGTNNTGNQLGQLEYCLEMIEECGLTPDNMFMPKPHEKKPVLVKGLPNKITG